MRNIMGKCDEIIELELMLIKKKSNIPFATKMIFKSYRVQRTALVRYVCMHFLEKLKYYRPSSRDSKSIKKSTPKY